MNFLTVQKDNDKRTFIRWTTNERVQHWVLAVSFVVLVFTGFALKYPDSWWFRPFSGIGWVFNFRGLIHRISGAIFIILGFYHLYYMFGTRRGRRLAKAFLPYMKDLKDFAQNVSYNFGFRKQPPQFDHFSYMEKSEYFALIWGAVMMGVSGLLLWFDEITLSFFPRWVIDLMTVIHLYEAWLATLAIVVWHFYYVIFNPDVYPLNTSMFNGEITEKELRDEYFLEWQGLQKDADGGQSETEGEKSEKAKVTEDDY